MFAGQEIDRLSERKQLLLAESQAHRTIIQLELLNLQDSLRWLQPAQKVVSAARPYGWALAAGAGLLMAWRSRSVLKWGLRSLEAWRLIRRFL